MGKGGLYHVGRGRIVTVDVMRLLWVPFISLFALTSMQPGVGRKLPSIRTARPDPRRAPGAARSRHQARGHQRLHAGDDDAVYGQRGDTLLLGASSPAISFTATLVVGEDPGLPVVALRRPDTRRSLEPPPPSAGGRHLDRRPIGDGMRRSWIRTTSRAHFRPFKGTSARSSRSSTHAVRCRISARSWTGTSRRFRRPIASTPALADVRLLTVTLDPNFDPPGHSKGARDAVVKADPAIRTFLTGDPTEVNKFASAVRSVRRAQSPGTPRIITHNLRPPSSIRRAAWSPSHSGNSWTPAELVADLSADARSHALTRSIPPALRSRRRSVVSWRACGRRMPFRRGSTLCPTTPRVGGETLRSFRGVVRTGTAHCLEAALFAAVVLEQHRYPPLVLSFESIDLLDHVIFVYRNADRMGSVARSRDPGLHGRRAALCDTAGAGAQLLRVVHRLHRTHQRCTPSSIYA